MTERERRLRFGVFGKRDGRRLPVWAERQSSTWGLHREFARLNVAAAIPEEPNRLGLAAWSFGIGHSFPDFPDRVLPVDLLMPLTNPQKTQLRRLAQNIPAGANIGKGGLADASVRHVDALLAQRELIKVRLLESAGEDRAETAEKLAAALSAELVDLVGRVVVLYRANPSLTESKRIELQSM